MEPDPHPRPLDRVFAAYSLVATLALLFPHHGHSWPAYITLHLIAAAAALQLPPTRRFLAAARRAWPRLARLVHDWYALVLLPALYTELAILNHAVWNGRTFDGVIQHVESAVFGGEPARHLAAAFPYLPLSEALHATYLLYYLIIFGPSLALYLMGRVHAFRVVTFGVVFTFLVHYVVFTFFPVQGPRYVFHGVVGAAVNGGPVSRLSRWLLEHGSVRGTAFPSSHMSVATVQAVLAYRYLRPVFPLFVVVALGVGVGAVYAGFHYAADMIVGGAAGLVLGLFMPRLYVSLGRREPATPQEEV
ncbi:MAG TPA: phosphatase PAP2 family protein [Longimicrobiales bacterium]|nr:phosphatase PAP2 family protein [Longimicrobiales bacterium]